MFITSISRQKKSTTLINEISRESENLYEMLEASCHICSHLYNSTEQIPMSICPQEHTYCSKCVADLFNINPHGTRCPTCRAYIYQKGLRINKSLLRICDLLPKLALRFASLEVQNQQLSQKVANYEIRLQHTQAEKKALACVDRTLNENRNKVEQKKRLPYIGNEPKPKKMNIHNYLARKRIFSSKAEKSSRKENNPLSLNKHLH